jgi:hypothetical protein
MTRLIQAVTLGLILLHGVAGGQEPPAHAQVPTPVASAAQTDSARDAPLAAANAELKALRDENLRLKRTVELLQRKTDLLVLRVRELEGAR